MKFVIFLEEIECVKEHKTLVEKVSLRFLFQIFSYEWQFSEFSNNRSFLSLRNLFHSHIIYNAHT